MPGRYGNLVEDLKILKDNGIEVIVNLTSKSLQVPPEFEDSFELLHVPIVDGQPPDIPQLNHIIRLVQNALSHKKRTVIHCRGGIGRTATILIPLIMELESLSLEEAIHKVKKSGRFTQSREQREFLETWARSRPG